jgi:Leucine Rich repeat
MTEPRTIHRTTNHRHLDLSYNSITAESACSMFDKWILNYTDLSTLSLRGNAIGDFGLMTIVGVLNSSPGLKLREVDFRVAGSNPKDNQLSNEGREILLASGALTVHSFKILI